MTLLRTEGLTKAFGELVAVDDVDLSVEEGGVHSVIGPNGAGKSTLFNLVTGLFEPTDGRVFFRDEEITGRAPSEIARLGISRSFQESDVYLGLTVAENIKTAAQAPTDQRRSMRLRANDLQTVNDRAAAALEDVGLADRAGIQARDLSHGERRELEIALTVVNDPQLLLLDEPTAGMGNRDGLDTVGTVQRLAEERDITIVMIEHDIGIVMSISDTVTVLQSGRVIAEGPPEAVQTDEKVRRAYLGLDADHDPHVESASGEPATNARTESGADPLLSLTDVHAAYGGSNVLRGVSIDVMEGEIVSLIGRNGVGKTTTLRTIAGVLPPVEGRVRFAGEDVSDIPDYGRVGRGMAYVPEDRQVFPELTVAENLRMGQVGADDGIFTSEEVYERFPRLRERTEQLGQQLSGGEQQMLAIARALLRPTSLLLLDEPSEGLAPQIVTDVLDIIEDIREAGVTVLLVEQNVRAAMGVADHHYVLHGGEITFEGTTRELEDADEAIDRYLGVGATIGASD